MADQPTTDTNGVPAMAVSPRMARFDYTHDNQSGGAGLLSTLLCGSDPPFALCDAPQDEVDFDLNPTGVFLALHAKKWNLVIERTKVYPSEASTWVIRHRSPGDEKALAPDNGSSSSDRLEAVAMASPRAGSQVELKSGQKVLRWRMLPLHLAVLFCSPTDVIKALLKAHPTGCSAHDDQGMLPLHLAFRSGCSEEIVLLLLDVCPEAIEQVDNKGRLPSMLAPKKSMNYLDSIGEAFVKGPAYYYWASRVATADRVRIEAAMTADRVRSETAMAKQIEQLEESIRVSNEREKKMSNGFSIENAELKERVAWYESKYDGAEEKEKVLVDHTNSLAERLRLTSLSEEHLATKLAKFESRLQNKEAELKRARTATAKEKEVLEFHVKEMEQILVKTKHKEKSLIAKLEKQAAESARLVDHTKNQNAEIAKLELRLKHTAGSDEKLQFEKERQLLEKQADASKECLMELINSSKQDKRRFEQEAKHLRRQLEAAQTEVQNQKQTFEKESEELRRQLKSFRNNVNGVAESTKGSSTDAVLAAIAPKSLEGKLDSLRMELADTGHPFVSHTNAAKHISQFSGTRKTGVQLDGPEKEAEKTNNGNFSQELEPQQAEEHDPQKYSYFSGDTRRNQPAAHSMQTPKSSAPRIMTLIDVKEEPFDTYVSTKLSSKSNTDDTRDDTECFSHLTDVDTAMVRSLKRKLINCLRIQSKLINVTRQQALGELSEEQRLALERLDLSGSKEEIATMLRKVPGLTSNQVNLLVDVASSLTV